ncbi:MAG: hypothetical protein ACPLQO_12895 [Desulfotomaculales bacterium]
MHSKNTKLRITSEENVVVVEAAPSEKPEGPAWATGQQEPIQCTDRVTGLPASTGPSLQKVPAEGWPESTAIPKAEAKVKIQELFTKTAGYTLPEAALNELVGYPKEYVEQKIRMLQTGKEKANTVGWLLEACREDYRHLPGPKAAGKERRKPPRLPDSRDDDKYRELYRLY